YPVFLKVSSPTRADTLSLHAALPIYRVPHRADAEPLEMAEHPGTRRARRDREAQSQPLRVGDVVAHADHHVERGDELDVMIGVRSEEHTSELQSRGHLVCRLLLEKKK